MTGDIPFSPSKVTDHDHSTKHLTTCITTGLTAGLNTTELNPVNTGQLVHHPGQNHSLVQVQTVVSPAGPQMTVELPVVPVGKNTITLPPLQSLQNLQSVSCNREAGFNYHLTVVLDFFGRPTGTKTSRFHGSKAKKRTNVPREI